jgi:hypothetical protein
VCCGLEFRFKTVLQLSLQTPIALACWRFGVQNIFSDAFYFSFLKCNALSFCSAAFHPPLSFLLPFAETHVFKTFGELPHFFFSSGVSSEKTSFIENRFVQLVSI